MPATIQNLSTGDHIFLFLVVGGMTLFFVSLFALWVRDNLGGQPANDRTVSQAVRPSEASVHAVGDSRHAA